MKKNNLLAFIAITTVFIFSACSKDNETPSALDYINDIIGNYKGVYTISDGSGVIDSAYTTIDHHYGNTIEIHCYGDLLDTTFVMDIYAEHDSILLCTTGEYFESTYGYSKGENHMSHNGNNSTEWEHHLGDEHENGDQHFGGFNMSNHSFGYTFVLQKDNALQNIRFEGIKE